MTFSGLKCPPFGESKGHFEEAGVYIYIHTLKIPNHGVFASSWANKPNKEQFKTLVTCQELD